MRGYARLCAHNSDKLQLSLLSQPPRMLSPQAPCTIQTNHTSRGSIPFRLYCLCTRRFVVRGPLSLSLFRPPGFRVPPHTGNPAHTTSTREEAAGRTAAGEKAYLDRIDRSVRPRTTRATRGRAPRRCLGGVATPPLGAARVSVQRPHRTATPHR